MNQRKILDTNKIQKEADKFRALYWGHPANYPVDSERMANKLGIFIQPSKVLDRFGISAFINGTFTTIYVSEEQYMHPGNSYAGRLRFSFAHELGHFHLHKQLYRSFSFKSVYEAAEHHAYSHEGEHKIRELSADEFAGRLIVPRYQFQRKLHDKIVQLMNDEPGLIGMVNAGATPVNDLMDLVQEDVAQEFGVSIDVIQRRFMREDMKEVIGERHGSGEYSVSAEKIEELSKKYKLVAKEA